MIEKIKLANNSICNLYLLKAIDKNSLEKSIDIVKQTDNGYAGFMDKKSLMEWLNSEIFYSGSKEKVTLPLKSNSLADVIKKTLNKIQKNLLVENDIEIYVFPTLSEFVLEKMKGIYGYTPWHNVMHLYISSEAPEDSDFDRNFTYAIAHEYNHIVRFKYVFEKSTLLDNLVSEGLAETFREDTLGGKPASWSVKLNKEIARNEFKDFGDLLTSENYSYKDYQEIFFGSEKYPVWIGYSVGYHLVKDFFKKSEKKSWNEIVQIPSETIAKKAGWV